MNNMLQALLLLIVLTPSFCYSYDQYEVGKAAGMYLAATDILYKLKKSECGYVIKTPVKTTKEVENEVLTFMNKQDRDTYREYINSPEYKQKLEKNNTIINQTISTAKSNSDLNTACGLAVGSLMNAIKNGQNAWANQINKR